MTLNDLSRELLSRGEPMNAQDIIEYILEDDALCRLSCDLGFPIEYYRPSARGAYAEPRLLGEQRVPRLLARAVFASLGISLNTDAGSRAYDSRGRACAAAPSTAVNSHEAPT